MRATRGDSDASPPLPVGLGRLARLWGLLVPRWEHCWVALGLQPWHCCCCWDQESSGQAPAFSTFHLCTAVSTGHAGLAEQRKKAGVLGKHRRMEDERPWEVVFGRGTSHATEMKVHEAEWLHQPLRACSWCVLIDTPIRARWGHTGSPCMLEMAMARMCAGCGHFYGE